MICRPVSYICAANLNFNHRNTAFLSSDDDVSAFRDAARSFKVLGRVLSRGSSYSHSLPEGRPKQRDPAS